MSRGQDGDDTWQQGRPGRNVRQRRRVRSQSCASRVGDGGAHPPADWEVGAPQGGRSHPPFGAGGGSHNLMQKPDSTCRQGWDTNPRPAE